MSHHKETHKIACKSCEATGLYVGMAERDGAAVVCHTCRGTGETTLTVEWDDFTRRKRRKDVTHVYGTNPGIVAAPSAVPGGVPYPIWETDGEAPHRLGTEMRQHTCPAWWYQAADYSQKPNWKECGWGRFVDCKHFPDKARCWARFDAEREKGA